MENFEPLKTGEEQNKEQSITKLDTIDKKETKTKMYS